ncbi:hypothetical protein ABAC460_09330 [Asticcacaulis sp. AC460]|uniref:c-type cytochrome n=1 Tax=Asticcacaulis sp. AC460 TaxID=1282360 RepID=UPI0003C3C403|nr:hypothetical protein [Asticcacaulis sp. AC460]ESQ90346.1 hypothetical protein ABAC460_09330 [Asticcacaulis sp. AC460]
MKAFLFLAVALVAASPASAKAPGTTPAVEVSADIQAGAALYFKACGLCHDDSAHMLLDTGPPLFGVVGRKVGSVEGFDYSPALQKANRKGHRWSEKRLDKFLSGPQHVYTGTDMPMMFNDPKVRHNLIAYLKTLKDE